MSILAQIALAALLFLAGIGAGIRWHAGQDAIAERAAAEARSSDARQQRMLNDRAALGHATQVAVLNSKLGDARAQIATLSGRTCLDAGTVGMLNDTGVQQPGAPAGEPAGAAAAAAASDRDVADYIATCRTRYGEVSEQLNRILDIEDRRQPLE